MVGHQFLCLKNDIVFCYKNCYAQFIIYQRIFILRYRVLNTGDSIPNFQTASLKPICENHKLFVCWLLYCIRFLSNTVGHIQVRVEMICLALALVTGDFCLGKTNTGVNQIRTQFLEVSRAIPQPLCYRNALCSTHQAWTR